MVSFTDATFPTYLSWISSSPPPKNIENRCCHRCACAVPHEAVRSCKFRHHPPPVANRSCQCWLCLGNRRKVSIYLLNLTDLKWCLFTINPGTSQYNGRLFTSCYCDVCRQWNVYIPNLWLGDIFRCVIFNKCWSNHWHINVFGGIPDNDPIQCTAQTSKVLSPRINAIFVDFRPKAKCEYIFTEKGDQPHNKVSCFFFESL